jgi:DNA-binding transcriptional ArsR family regulator
MSSEDEEDRIFKALGNRVRRRMLDRLKSDPATTGALCDAFSELDRCTVMQHLKVLEEAGLVVARKDGRERWNHLNAIPIAALHERWIGSYAAYAAEKLLQLQHRLEGRPTP